MYDSGKSTDTRQCAMVLAWNGTKFNLDEYVERTIKRTDNIADLLPIIS